MCLCFSNNNLSAEAARAIAQGLAKNQSVETIMVRYTDDYSFLSRLSVSDNCLCVANWN